MIVSFREYFKTQVEERYIKPSTDDRFSSTFVPHVLLRTINNENLKNEYFKDKTFISPNLATMTGFKNNSISLINLISYSNIDLKKISSNLMKIKRDGNVKLVSIGYGGFSINLITFISMLAEYCSIDGFLKELIIFEDDKISLTNSFRIYKDMSQIEYGDGHKFNLFTENNIANKVRLKKRYFKQMDLNKLKEESESGEKMFIIGAPDFDTRKMLEDTPFIFTGHSGNEIEFYSSPVVDSDLTRGTYGKIHLDYFFLNIFKSAEKMIDIMANQIPEEFEKDKLIFKYTSEGRL